MYVSLNTTLLCCNVRRCPVTTLPQYRLGAMNLRLLTAVPDRVCRLALRVLGAIMLNDGRVHQLYYDDRSIAMSNLV